MKCVVWWKERRIAEWDSSICEMTLMGDKVELEHAYKKLMNENKE